MIVLISGGSGSGKSAFAEDFITSRAQTPLYYIATMKLWDEECRKRAEKHQAMRQGKGFSTLECPSDLFGLVVASRSSVLLEDLSNLLANETYGVEGEHSPQDRVFTGITQLAQSTSLLVVVTNELYSDGISYPPETTEFLRNLASLNRRIAQISTAVYEVVAGIPISVKGEEP